MKSVLEDLISILRHFNGREYSGDIGPETLFFADLGMASIDAVVLAEKLEQHYGQKFPFSSFLLKLQMKKIKDLQIGELAEFLHEHLKGSK